MKDHEGIEFQQQNPNDDDEDEGSAIMSFQKTDSPQKKKNDKTFFSNMQAQLPEAEEAIKQDIEDMFKDLETKQEGKNVKMPKEDIGKYGLYVSSLDLVQVTNDNSLLYYDAHAN